MRYPLLTHSFEWKVHGNDLIQYFKTQSRNTHIHLPLIICICKLLHYCAWDNIFYPIPNSNDTWDWISYFPSPSLHLYARALKPCDKLIVSNQHRYKLHGIYDILLTFNSRVHIIMIMKRSLREPSCAKSWPVTDGFSSHSISPFNASMNKICWTNSRVAGYLIPLHSSVTSMSQWWS